MGFFGMVSGLGMLWWPFCRQPWPRSNRCTWWITQPHHLLLQSPPLEQSDEALSLEERLQLAAALLQG